MLIETAKQRVQPMLLEDFNYLINKVQIMYVNKQYAAFSANQKVDDNTRVLVSRALLDVEKCEWYPEVLYNGLPGAYYECNLPLDYMHILSVECIFQAEKQIYCYNKGDTFGRMAIRMTPDMENSVRRISTIGPATGNLTISLSMLTLIMTFLLIRSLLRAEKKVC